MTANIFNIQHFSVTDGPGARTVVFFQGCNLRCAWCHNPESWRLQQPPTFIRDKCLGCGACNGRTEPGKCFSGALVNTTHVFTPKQLWELLESEIPYYQNSGGGITFSGGECALQAEFLGEIIRICKQNGVHTAMDTAGHVPFEQLTQPGPDLYLYDIKAATPEKHQQLTGVDGLLIWENLNRLVADGYTVQVRVPAVPGANWDELPLIAKRLGSMGITNAELLPYHTLGEGKAPMLGDSAFEINHFKPPQAPEMEAMQRLFTTYLKQNR